ncbi:6-hydroxymethylpterin diphosphokinase MptE-like protein [Alteromonas portus]|uniref:motility associated factor glycosyltransferase family protein n=1 Tax=Alteromonas portus TaxID=2565549 RepID=UPI003BF7DB6C
MLKAIKFYLLDDEEQQSSLEVESAYAIKKNKEKSLIAFKRVMPVICAQLMQSRSTSTSVFVNKDKELDIVDFNSGKVLYGEQVTASIHKHVDAFLRSPSVLNKDGFSQQAVPLDDNADVLVVLGLALGIHLLKLVRETNFKSIILYEPNFEYTHCSMYTGVWPEIFKIAAGKGTAIYFQSQRDGSSVLEDLSELKQVSPFTTVYFYQHYHSVSFDSVMRSLSELSIDNIQRRLFSFPSLQPFDDYLVPWSPIVTRNNWDKSHLSRDTFDKNIAAFSKYYPDIANEFKDYVPLKWEPRGNKRGEVNLFHIETSTPLHGESPKHESELAYEAFVRQPNRDNLILGYAGGKLIHYSHHKMVKRIQEHLAGMEEEEGELPETVKSMLLFGMGAGYQLEALSESRDIEKLFVCEPNRDYFFASLYAIDWAAILSKVEEKRHRIYLNIGDDGSNLVRDLLSQFHSIGTHIIANTYLSLGYDNEVLLPAVDKLREDLRLIVAMGEYFEHARFGTTHTKWAVENNIGFYRKAGVQRMGKDLSDVAVFIVGNGPSLDSLMPLLKEERENAIVISCGTALQAMYSNGIVPDFHAEVESNRASFDWASRIGDKAYLKQINFISCNGVHPDTAELYKNTYLAFKEGESSTVFMKELFPELDLPFLHFSYPTVSNFVINYVLELGFKQVYLFGVDLGMVDVNHHHSKSSGYYKKDGGELFNHAERIDTSLVVPGNLRPYVNTKFEFNMSKSVIEKNLAAFSDADVYNLNDGAKIVGSPPLEQDALIITNSLEDKQAAMNWIQTQAHVPIPADEFQQRFAKRFNHEALIEDITSFKALSEREFNGREDIDKLVFDQRKFLVEAYLRKCSILFFYFNGTSNYINSIFSKLTHFKNDDLVMEKFEAIRECWHSFLDDALTSISMYPDAFDTVSSFTRERQEITLQEFTERERVAFVSDSVSNVLSALEINQNTEDTQCHYQIEVISSVSGLKERKADVSRTAYIVNDSELLVALHKQLKPAESNILVFCPFEGFDDKRLEKAVFTAVLALTSSDKLQLVFPKLEQEDWGGFFEDYFPVLSCGMTSFETYNMFALASEPLADKEMTNEGGDRFWLCPRPLETSLCETKLIFSKKKSS